MNPARISRSEVRARADPGIFDRGGGGPNFTQYAETVLQLIASTLRQFSFIVHHIPSFSFFDWFRLSHRRHITKTGCFCSPARLFCKQSQLFDGSRKEIQTRTSLVFS